MVQPWRKHNSNRRLPRRPRQQPQLPEPWPYDCNREAIQWNMKSGSEAVEEKERPLELHCAALDEDKYPKISKLNECFIF